MKKAIFSGAILGGLIGYGEAVYVQKLSKLYFTILGRLGLIPVAVLAYAVYGSVAGALLFLLWRRIWRSAEGRALLSSSVMAWCLLYGFGYLVVFRLMHKEIYRFLIWGGSVFIVSFLLSFIVGWAFGELLFKGRRSMWIGICAFIVITLWMLFPGSRRAVPRNKLPNIVMVTLDTLRADRLHSYGNERIRTPTMDQVASEGVLFENAISQIPRTNPSHLSILSSLYPHQHGVVENMQRHSKEIPKIVHELKEHGYQTAAFIGSFPLDSRFGFSDGFDIYDDDFSRIKGYHRLTLIRVMDWFLRIAGGASNRTAGQTNRDLLSWLGRCARPPFFLWVHYIDPHGPYEPPSPYSEMYYEGKKDDPGNRSMEGIEMPFYWPPSARDFTDIAYPVAQYDAEVTYTDAELGRLLKEIDSRFGDTVLVIVSDHGESLTEHGHYFHHGPTLYEEEIRVPLIIRGRGRVEPARVSSLVETIDIAPTILEIVGLEVPSWCQGGSLLPLMRGEAPGTKEGAISETTVRKREGAIDIAYRTERYKLIVKPGEGVELYDLENDPGELHDISKEREDLVKAYEERIRSALESQAKEASVVMDYETQEKLRSLGYLR